MSVFIRRNCNLWDRRKTNEEQYGIFRTDIIHFVGADLSKDRLNTGSYGDQIMNRLLVLLTVVFMIIFFSAGCAATAPPVEPEVQSGDQSETASTDSIQVRRGTIHVLVDGNDRGVLPKMVQIRRSFGDKFVSLYQGEEEFRIYELETSVTPGGQRVLNGFWSDNRPEGIVYDIRHLDKKNDDYYYIPYTEYPIIIEDNLYNLTIRIMN